MRANATTSNHDYKCLAKFLEPIICQEDTIACQLFEDQSFIVISQSRSSGQCRTSFIVSVPLVVLWLGTSDIIDLASRQSAVWYYYHDVRRPTLPI